MTSAVRGQLGAGSATLGVDQLLGQRENKTREGGAGQEERREAGGERRELAPNVLGLYLPPQLGHMLLPVTFIAVDSTFQTPSLSILEHQEPLEIRTGLPNPQGIGVTPQPVTLAQQVRGREGLGAAPEPPRSDPRPHAWTLRLQRGVPGSQCSEWPVQGQDPASGQELCR